MERRKGQVSADDFNPHQIRPPLKNVGLEYLQSSARVPRANIPDHPVSSLDAVDLVYVNRGAHVSAQEHVAVKPQALQYRELFLGSRNVKKKFEPRAHGGKW